MKTGMPISLKPTSDDVTLIKRLTEKLGVGTSQIPRLAIRALAKNQKVSLN